MWPNKPLLEDVYHDFLFKSDADSYLYLLLDRRNRTISCLRFWSSGSVSKEWNTNYSGAVMGYHSVWFGNE